MAGASSYTAKAEVSIRVQQPGYWVTRQDVGITTIRDNAQTAETQVSAMKGCIEDAVMRALRGFLDEVAR